MGTTCPPVCSSYMQVCIENAVEVPDTTVSPLLHEASAALAIGTVATDMTCPQDTQHSHLQKAPCMHDLSGACTWSSSRMPVLCGLARMPCLSCAWYVLPGYSQHPRL